MTSLTIDGVSLDYPIYDANQSFRKALLQSTVGGVIRRNENKSNRVSVSALDNVSIRLKQGDRLGLIGANGGGKTTLLKVMAGVYVPDRGTVTAEGRLSCLFAGVPGIEDYDNAYQNIATVGRFFGMSKQQIADKIASIEEFCELGDYMHMPLRTYSAGMMARLTFAIATSMDPEILLMDEGIGAGDARFAHKAKARIEAFLSRAHIVVLASHSSELIREICNQAVLMQAGRIIEFGSVEDILAKHAKMCEV